MKAKVKNVVVQRFLNLHPELIDDIDLSGKIDCVEVDGYIYMTCNILTHGKIDYIIIHEPYGYDDFTEYDVSKKNRADHVDKAVIQPDNWTPYNQGYYAQKCPGGGIRYCDNAADADVIHIGVGAALLIINKGDYVLKSAYYFPDTYNIGDESEIVAVINDKIIVRYAEYHYVFSDGSFTNFGFVAAEYRIFGKFLINFWHYGYDARCPWQLINLENLTCQDIIALDMYPEAKDVNDCLYDFETSEFVFLTSKGSKIAMGINELRATKDQISRLRFSNLGTEYGYCRLLL